MASAFRPVNPLESMMTASTSTTAPRSSTARSYSSSNSNPDPVLGTTPQNDPNTHQMQMRSPSSTPRPSTAPLLPRRYDSAESSPSSQQQHHQPQPLTLLPQPPSEPPLAPAIMPAPQRQPSQSRPFHHDIESTPTRATFSQNDALASQKPLPTAPFPQAVAVPDFPADAFAGRRPTRGNSQHSRKSRESDDAENMMDIDDSDTETAAGGDTAKNGGTGDDANSDDDDGSVGPDGRGGKKKKSQRFYCTDYPPCNLSFTRSEHLARHIRKHTGERPFQCHCSRRFSRLDNLRQHAQTVHVNEEIPLDSLASNARFSRHFRAERRATTSRVRASSRGHSKSLSTSSITSSIASINSVYNSPQDGPRPPPLAAAPGDPRNQLALDGSYRNSDGYPYGRPVSPSDFSTPHSATFSASHNSPLWGASGVASPISTHSRSQSLYAPGARAPARRLSVPGGTGAPFTSPLGPRLPQGSTPGPAPGPYSPAPSTLGPSPVTSTMSDWSQRDSAAEDYRRRTWHPDMRVSSTQPPNQSQAQAPAPAPTPSCTNTSNATTPTQFLPNSGSGIRLPPITSFDPLHQRDRPEPSAMQIDKPGRNPPLFRPLTEALRDMREGRCNLAHLDIGLHRGLTRLDITSSPNTLTPPRDGAGQWANEAEQAVQAQAEYVRQTAPTVRFEAVLRPLSHLQMRPLHQHTMSAPSITTTRDQRNGRYQAQQSSSLQFHAQMTAPLPPPPQPPVQQHHTLAPAEPRSSFVNRLEHPNLSFGFPARSDDSLPTAPPAPYRQQDAGSQGQSSVGSMGKLQALVAVATSEQTTAY